MEPIERSLTGNKDADKEILLRLDDKTILNFCKTSKYGNVLCQDENFWIRKINSKYPLLKEFKKDNETWRRFFIRMTYYIAKLDEEFGIPYIPTKGYDPEEFYNQWNKDKEIYSEAMYYAAKGGHLNIVQYLIDKKGAIWFNDAMKEAAKRGHLNIVKYLIDEKGANEFNYAMVSAAEGGHLGIVQYLIDEKGANHFNWALERAAYGGHLEIVKYLIDEKGANDFNWALERAAKGGHLEIVKYLIEKGARNFKLPMIYAEGGGHPEIVEYLKQFV